MKMLLKYSLAALVIALGTSTAAHADPPWWHHDPPHYRPHSAKPNVAPEIDPSLAVSGLALLGGTLTVVRARRRK